MGGGSSVCRREESEMQGKRGIEKEREESTCGWGCRCIWVRDGVWVLVSFTYESRWRSRAKRQLYKEKSVGAREGNSKDLGENKGAAACYFIACREGLFACIYAFMEGRECRSSDEELNQLFKQTIKPPWINLYTNIHTLAHTHVNERRKNIKGSQQHTRRSSFLYHSLFSVSSFFLRFSLCLFFLLLPILLLFLLFLSAPPPFPLSSVIITCLPSASSPKKYLLFYSRKRTPSHQK